MDACTVAALDAITAFAVPNPNCSSQSRRFFRVRLPSGSPRQAECPTYFRLIGYYPTNPFDRRPNLNMGFKEACQCPFLVQSVGTGGEAQQSLCEQLGIP